MLDGDTQQFTYFENDVLSQDKNLLPQCALDVLAGKDASNDYWQFLITQLEISDYEKSLIRQ